MPPFAVVDFESHENLSFKWTGRIKFESRLPSISLSLYPTMYQIISASSEQDARGSRDAGDSPTPLAHSPPPPPQVQNLLLGRSPKRKEDASWWVMS